MELADKVWNRLSKKQRQWVWFAALWCGGLFAVTAMAYPIKWLIRSIG